jgi:hypothetical protein
VSEVSEVSENMSGYQKEQKTRFVICQNCGMELEPFYSRLHRCEKNVYIQCNNIELEIWSRIAKFENEYYIRNYLPERLKVLEINNSFYEQLAKNKEEFSKVNDKIETLNLLSESDIKDTELILRIANTAKQAKEFYNAAQSLPLLSKPIVVMYTYEKLAELLVLTTFDFLRYEREKPKRYSHGLTFDPSNLTVLVKSTGLFNFLHDCYDQNPEVYSKLYAFKLDNILRRNVTTTFYRHYHEEREENLISFFDLFTYRRYGNNIEIASNDKTIRLHELDREFLFTFAISTLSRYNVNIWSNILAGKDSDLIIKITEYLQTTQSMFPNLILNKLLNSNHIFVPIGFMGKDTINKIVEERERRGLAGMY